MGELVTDSLVSGSSTALAILMGHEISIDESLVGTIPDYSPELLGRADQLALLLQKAVDAQINPTVGEGGGSSIIVETLSVMCNSAVTVACLLSLFVLTLVGYRLRC